MRKLKMLKELNDFSSSNEVKYDIKHDEVVGRYMVAKEDIKSGDAIYIDRPAAIGPDNSSLPICLGCYKRVSGSFFCRKCKWPMCGERCCQKDDHKLGECRLFQDYNSKGIYIPWYDKPCAYYDAILPIRLLAHKIYNPGVFELIMKLMDHANTIESTLRQIRQRTVNFIRRTCMFTKIFTEDEVHHVLGVIGVNSFVIQDSDNDCLDLIGLYPWTSIMSHHCTANSKIVMANDFTYTCVAAVNIEKGEEIATNYHHYHYQMYGTVYRRSDLKNTWSFECTCKRCQDPTEFGTYVSGVTCESCKAGYCLPIQSTDFDSKWKCDECSTPYLPDHITAKVDALEKLLNAIDENQTTYETSLLHATDKPSKFEEMLRKMRNALHPNHYLILDTKRKLIDIYGSRPGFELYKLPKEILERKIEYCTHLLEVASVLCPGPTDMRGYLLLERSLTRIRLAQWSWIRMRIVTSQYLGELISVQSDLGQVQNILTGIRLDSDEGKMCLKATEEMTDIRKIISQLSKPKCSRVSDDMDNGGQNLRSGMRSSHHRIYSRSNTMSWTTHPLNSAPSHISISSLALNNTPLLNSSMNSSSTTMSSKRVSMCL